MPQWQFTEIYGNLVLEWLYIETIIFRGMYKQAFQEWNSDFMTIQNDCSVHRVNEQTIQRTEARIQLCKSHWHAMPSQTVMNDDINVNSQGCKDHGLGSAIWASKSVANRLFLDHFMVILNKTTLTSWWTVHWLIICRLFNTVQIRHEVKLNVISSFVLKFTPSVGRGRSAVCLNRTILLITGIYLTFWHLAGV